MENNGKFNWDIKKLSESLYISENDVKLYFTDGRKVSFLYERRLTYEIVKGKLAQSEGKGYDIIDLQGNKWEVRSITKRVYFNPSNQVGSQRKFDEIKFLEKLQEIKGYILVDIMSFPEVPFWIIDKQIVLDWWNQKKLGKITSISRKKMLKLLEEIEFKNDKK